jgi:hypothetical protein
MIAKIAAATAARRPFITPQDILRVKDRYEPT